LERNCPRDGQDVPKGAGAYSLAEIVSQPECWRSCLTNLRESGMIERGCDFFDDADEWLFIG
jgi:hypothetical protein